MTEKEFLKNFIKHLNKNYWNISYVESALDGNVNQFLEEHHKEYYEVEFVRIGCELDDLGIVQHTKACKNDCVYKDK